jgi:hypothetical protein
VKQLVNVRFPVADADQRRLRTMPLRFSDPSKALQPLGVFLLLDRALLAVVFADSA